MRRALIVSLVVILSLVLAACAATESALGRNAEVPVKISHLKLRGRINWHLFDNVINKLETACVKVC